MKMDKPCYGSSEIATCVACSITGAGIITLVSFVCPTLFTGGVV